MKGTFPGPIQPLSAILPGIDEQPGGQPKFGPQVTISVPLAEVTVAGATTYVGCWIAPSDGWYIEDAFVSAVTVPTHATSTLALENYDKSATTSKNPFSATNQSLTGLTAKQGAQITLSTTQSNREMDEGDTLNATLVQGAGGSAGRGIALTLLVRGPEVNPQ